MSTTQAVNHSYARCPKCGFDNANEASFCEQCGTRLSRLCPNCGYEASPSAQFCRACGAPLGLSPPPIHYTPSHLAERILAEQAALEARGATTGERKTISRVAGRSNIAPHRA